MKILNPDTTTHIITLQPRFEPTTDFVVEFTNMDSKVVTVVDDIYTYTSGVLNLMFDFTCLESEQYFIKITESDIVIFRGSIFCTNQDPQDYKISKDKFTYV